MVTSTFSMQKEKVIIEGDLFIVPNSLKYAEGMMFKEQLESQLKTKLQDSDVLVQVWVTSEECKDWENHQHPKLDKAQRFPGMLLYRMLKGKKEGDVINLEMYNKSFVLHLNQLKHCYPDSSFHAKLEQLKNIFLKRPNFYLSGAPTLLKAGILIEDHFTIDKSKCLNDCFGKYKHGPNGFKDE